jgi:hypothetical protein
MNRATWMLVALALLLGSVGRVKADIIYSIENYASLQNGYTLSGTITTDRTIGTLNESDIKAFNLT